MRKIYVLCLTVFCFGLLAGRVWAIDLELVDGTKVSGEIILPATEDGLNLKQGDGEYKRVPWDKFSQASLQELDKNPKITQFVDGLIEPPEEEREKMTEVDIKPVERLDRPQAATVIGGLVHSSVGLFSLVLVYLAGLYAAYEIAVVRAYPIALVCGISAILPVLGQIIFLCLPMNMTNAEKLAAQRAQAEAEAQALAQPQQAAEFHTTEEHAEGAGGLHLAHGTEAAPASNLPETLVFARGKFTFNRRFFETKFAGFFGMVRRDAEKDMVLIISSARGEYEAHRISRITANEMHLEVRKGNASQEVTVPFSEIKEVKLKHKDAP